MGKAKKKGRRKSSPFRVKVLGDWVILTGREIRRGIERERKRKRKAKKK